MIQKGRPSNRVQKAITRQVNLATHSPPSTTEYLSGSESCITFDKRDHPPQVPRPGHCPLVLEAQIGGFDMSHVFMDGGSGINLIFASTLRAMRIPLTHHPPLSTSVEASPASPSTNATIRLRYLVQAIAPSYSRRKSEAST